MPQDVQSILADPNFSGLPTAERIKVLNNVDPNFASLDGGEKLKVVTSPRLGMSSTLIESRRAASKSEFERNKPYFEKPGGANAYEMALDFGQGVEKTLGLDPAHPIKSI